LPYEIGIHAADNVYVSDMFNDRIQRFDASGNFVGAWGTAGSENGQMEGPLGVATDRFGNVFVADSGNNRVQKFTSTGTWVRGFGVLGSQPGELSGPSGVAVGRDGMIFVTDTGNGRVQKFDQNGIFVSEIGSTEAVPCFGGFDAPAAITIDPAGHLYVTDTSAGCVQKFASDGTYLSALGEPDGVEGRFSLPSGIATGPGGAIYVVETGQSRVARWQAAAPVTYINEGPLGTTSDNTPLFTFLSLFLYSPTFECSIDYSDFLPCPSSFELPELVDGAHVLQVRAVDSDGADASPARRDFIVDSSPPVVTIVSAPELTNDRTPTFRFISDEANSTFRCTVDANPTSTCSSPYTAPSLLDGSHTLSVRAVDRAGNESALDSVPFTVDATRPETTITGPSTTTSRRVTFLLSFSEEIDRVRCSLDGASFAPCNDTYTTPVLGLGSHELRVKAIDDAGNRESPPAEKDFLIRRR
jgi:sugar lactone lactonase YvrE